MSRSSSRLLFYRCSISRSPANVPSCSFRLSSSSSSSTHASRSIFGHGSIPAIQKFEEHVLSLSNKHDPNEVIGIYREWVTQKVPLRVRTASILTWALLKQSNFEEAEDFLVAQMENLEFSPSIGMCSSLIRGLCRIGKPERAMEFLKNQITRGIMPNSFCFSLLINSLISRREMSSVVDAFVEIAEKRIRIDNVVFSSVLSCYCKIGKPELATEFYEKMIDVGVRPNLITYTVVMNALSKLGRMEEVEKLVRMLEQEKLVYDLIFYSSWACGYVRVGALDLVQVFQKHKEMKALGIKPDVISYTILIDALCRLGEVEKAVGFLHKMFMGGVKPSLVTYTAVMRGFCQKGKLNEAFDLFYKMEEFGLQADEACYTTLMDGLCRIGDLDQVFCLLEEMESKKVPVTLVTYNVVMNGLSKIGKTEKADEILRGIEAGDVYTYTTILDGYCKEKNVEGVLGTMQKLDQAVVALDLVACNVLIKALCMVHKLEEAEKIFKKLPSMGLIANSVTYCVLIDGLCKGGWIYEAFKTFNDYRHSIIIPATTNYNCMIGGLCREGMLSLVVEIFAELVKRGLVPDTITYMLLLKTHWKKGRTDDVFRILQCMRDLDIEEQTFVCNSMIIWFHKQGLFREAFEVCQIMIRKCFTITRSNYSSIIKGLMRSNDRRNVQQLLSRFLKDYGIIDPKLCGALFIYLCKKDVKDALSFLVRIREDGVQAKVSTLILRSLMKEGRTRDAYALVLEADGREITMDVFTYSKLIDSLWKEGFFKQALELCLCMGKRGIYPNIVTYNAIIHGLCQEGCLLEAFRLFDALEKNNVRPTVVTYSSLIASLTREGLMQDARLFFRGMVHKGLTPNIFIYNLLINGYCRLGMLDEALELLLDLEKSSIEPDYHTINALIKGFGQRGNMEGALRIFGEFISKGIAPDFFGYMVLAKGLCATGRMEETRTILVDMLDRGSMMSLIQDSCCDLDAAALVSHLAILCEEGSIKKAINLLNQVESLILKSGVSRGGALLESFGWVCA
ncbi:pentatricopeptide repeat-containing protein At5g57250, mitochondrial [Nymphaea colorata]|nr:pentatricopeptide repeat-containing protein At5g57250, mitochondrial [Nymphaea colorata]XP_031476198.1 pentatricopeptide repeat-containing protein At5g57250, mitochondrial [Nymphaea colorata]XP_031476199.1 pentatricopeptide repeat-containing protein At5g57250, mitochondrial [Nymphaea colorata]XP_031476201.1 pentatricopeptide repeat-containing protein At5g57250, mitochondrial [Nymphaea colorata]XP_031476203.1 pentatricopeptide repeat-containing protein At5g57250, mitochondrial [Nymphaea color